MHISATYDNEIQRISIQCTKHTYLHTYMTNFISIFNSMKYSVYCHEMSCYLTQHSLPQMSMKVSCNMKSSSKNGTQQHHSQQPYLQQDER